MKKAIWILGIVVLLVVSCQKKIEFPLDMDIVFQLADTSDDVLMLGFADSSTGRVITMEVPNSGNSPEWPPGWPSWSSDGRQIIARRIDEQGLGYWGFTSFKMDGTIDYFEHRLIGDDRGAALTDDGKQAIALTSYDEGVCLSTFSLMTGEIEQDYICKPGHEQFIEYGSRVLQPPYFLYLLGRELYESEELGGQYQGWYAQIVLLNTETGEHKVLFEDNWLGFPAISPNGRWIVYTGADGIYVLDLENYTEIPRQLTGVEIVRPLEPSHHRNFSHLVWPPIPSWSPDSQWIVYHKCNIEFDIELCAKTSNNDIYKVNVNTGEEVLLVRQGLNPYWRLAEVETSDISNPY